MINVKELRNNFETKNQQGDVIIRKVKVSLSELKPKAGNVVQESNHPHIIRGGNLFEANGLLFVKVAKKGVFEHQSSRGHKPITVGPGIYFIDRIVEVDFLGDMIRPVVD